MLAGLVATGAMSVLMAAAKRAGALGESPPRRITRRLLAPLGRLRPDGAALNGAALGAHLAFGASLGALYGLLPARAHSRAGGSLFGALAWTANYAGWLPKTGLMPPPSRDRPGRPATMVAAHLLFGRVLAATHHLLFRRDAALRGKVAVVCGGSRGLGRAIARELLREGASVAICARDPQKLEDARAWLESFDDAPGRVLAQVCDLRSEVQTLELLDSVTRELGPIDVLVANAASIVVGPIETLTPSDFDSALREIFGTAVRASLGVLPAMRARGKGTLVFIDSVGGKVGVPHLAAYSAAKFAETGYAEALRAEVAKDGVRVLTVFPGLMRTGSHTRVSFRGHPEQELAWFGAAAITPLVAIDTFRAARRVVGAIVEGETRLTYTPAARLALAMHDFLPGLWSVLIGIVARLLPRAPTEPREQREGAQLLAQPSNLVLRAIASCSKPLALRHGQ